MTNDKLLGRHALITGASRGIGAAIAMTLAKQDCLVTLVGRSETDLAAVAASLPAQAKPKLLVVDVTNSAEVNAAFQQARQTHGPIQILINNAGQAASAPLLRTDDELWHRIMAVNLHGTFYCSRAALGDMLEVGWGRIVNIASIAGQKGYAYISAYAASKHAVIGLTRSLAIEVAKKNITVNAVCPGYTETNLIKYSMETIIAKTGMTEAQVREDFTKHNPQARLLQPQEIADAVGFLCTAAAQSINGQSLSISGGEVM